MKELNILGFTKAVAWMSQILTVNSYGKWLRQIPTAKLRQITITNICRGVPTMSLFTFLPISSSSYENNMLKISH